MKVKNFDGFIVTWDLRGYEIKENDCRPRSELHINTRKLLRQLYPLSIIMEEVKLPTDVLFLDFFIPQQKLAVEVQGQQHLEYNSFFHGSKQNFQQSKVRDNKKKQFCLINNIRLVELLYNESVEEWKMKILKL